ncbi:methyltransferase domain-containing protein [Streptomyces sp. NPDC020490]|uniref:methyltransferase domain-containing protein n=1 Tax=Streptomyces sp. NPDC020490 TaxID=3365078 RepID=UPI00378E09E3
MRPFSALPTGDRSVAAQTYLETVSRHPRTAELRDLALEALPLTEGESVLEVGCGLGEMARRLARRTGPRGRVTAVDHDPAMVAAARHRHDSAPGAAGVDYRVEDACRLTFTSGEFDVVWCERVLQHVPDPGRAVREMCRVTAPGGRVCVLDVDWRSLRVDGVGQEIAGPVLTSFASIVPGPDVAGRVPGLIAAAGFDQVWSRQFTATFASLAEAKPIIPLFDRTSPLAARHGDGSLDTWFDLLDAADARNELVISLSTWITIGTRPSTTDRPRV